MALQNFQDIDGYSCDMVDRVAVFWVTNGDGHHGLETSLRNKSGKVLNTRNMRCGTNPAILRGPDRTDPI